MARSIVVNLSEKEYVKVRDKAASAGVTVPELSQRLVTAFASGVYPLPSGVATYNFLSFLYETNKIDLCREITERLTELPNEVYEAVYNKCPDKTDKAVEAIECCWTLFLDCYNQYSAACAVKGQPAESVTKAFEELNEWAR